MSDAMTTTASVGLDQAAYDRLAYFGLRSQLHFDNIADVQPTRQSMPGSSVIFTLVTDLSVASTALNESVDVDAVALADANVTVTLVEYGNAMITSAKIRKTSYVEVNPVVANVVGFNAGISQDTIARDVLKAGTNVRYSTVAATDPDARNKIEPSDIISAHDVRLIHADLATANVVDFNGYYAAFIHPHVALDLREETGAAAWRDPHTYSQPGQIWNGEIGEFEGFRFTKTDRAPLFADAGSSTTLTDVYRTIFCGRQALAKAWSSAEGGGPNPSVVMGTVVDKLKRFVPIGWYWMGGYSIFRQSAVRALETSSSMGTNA